MKLFNKIILMFVIWRVSLICVLLLSFKFMPLGNIDKFLGGGFINYMKYPLIFPWANYDGEHYLSIAIFGYKGLEQAFFPVYPWLISILAKPFMYDLPSALISTAVSGLIISNILLIIALIFLFKLIRIDYSDKIGSLVLILLLIFPTSFYLGSVYSESLLLLLIVGSFYSARKKKWWLSGILAAIASGTKIFGILLLPALLIEWWVQKSNKRDLFWILLSPLGLIAYMFYQYNLVGDPLAFYHLQGTIGEQRQLGIVLYPQVIYRYITMLLTVDPTNSIYQTIVLEFITGITFFILPFIGYFKKVRLSYLFFALAGFILSPLQGSFSSVPRYVLILFPSFLVLALIFDKLPKLLKVLIFMGMAVGLILETSLFIRGYWVA